MHVIREIRVTGNEKQSWYVVEDADSWKLFPVVAQGLLEDGFDILPGVKDLCITLSVLTVF